MPTIELQIFSPRWGHDDTYEMGGLCGQSAQTQMYRTGVRLGQTVGRIRQVMCRGRERVEQLFLLTQPAYAPKEVPLGDNLTRMRTLAAKAA